MIKTGFFVVELAEMKYGDVALGVEAALPAIPAQQNRRCGYLRLICGVTHRTLIWLCAAFKRWA